MSPRIAACLLAIGWSASRAAADRPWSWSAPPELTTAQQVRNLSPDAAAANLPVKLTGVVTHVNPEPGDFFVQDATAGVHVCASDLSSELTQGDRVELEGTTGAGAFAPEVTPLRLRVIEKGVPLPDPLPFNLSAEDSRWLDSQWVQAWVVVHNASTGPGVTRLDVDSPHGRAILVVPGQEWAVPAMALKGMAVVVRGVCLPTIEDHTVSGRPRIYLSGLPIPPATEPQEGPDGPVRLIDALLQFSPTPHPGARRVKIAGVVTALPLPGVVVVQDGSGGALVWTDQPRHDLAVGQRVEAYGRLRIEGRRVGLSGATIKILGPGDLPEPLPIQPGDLASGVRDLLLVRLDGRVEQVRERDGWTAITLTNGVGRFETYTPGAPDTNGLDRLEPGSLVAVVGVPLDATPGGEPPAGPGLFLRGPEAVTILEPPARPPWWTTNRVGYLVGGFTTVVILGCAWVVLLRNRVLASAAEIAHQSEEKEKLRERLREAAKNEAIGQLTGEIVHDFNNDLTVINGCAEILAEEVADRGGRVTELAEDIRHAGERAAGLTGQLLTFSRRREARVTAVDLNAVVADAVRLLDRLTRETIRVQSRLTPALPPVHGDPVMLHEVVMNLAVNARDAMPQGGTLTLATTRPEPGWVRLSVSDTGVGMTDEVKAKIFKRFFTTKGVGKGTGLGLAAVHDIVQTLQGRIQVDSAVGRGTTFHIDLRVHDGPPADLAQTPLPPSLPVLRGMPAAKLSGLTILVVEDDEMVRNVLVTGLTAEGPTILVADRPEYALQIVATHPGRIDVLVTDVVMPGMGGRELAERVRGQRPGVRAVFMSGYTPDEVLRQGVLRDRVEFLQKPFTPDQLATRVLQVLSAEC